jgi:Raf kinase inhibitor-like YbhB/YbcL family protein
MPVSTVYRSCGGSNVSPPLAWSRPPAGTKSLALIVHDPDAPHPGGWYHWIVYNLSPSRRALPAGVRLANTSLGRTSFDDEGYGGPCPPPGKPHHYVFMLYALDVAQIPSKTPLTGPELEARIDRHVMGTAELTGLYGR